MEKEIRIKRLGKIDFFRGCIEEKKLAELYSILQLVIEQTDLSDLDLLCIRDLLDHSNEPEREIFLILVLLFQLGRKGSLCLEVSPSYLQVNLSQIIDSRIVDEITGCCLKKLGQWETDGHELISRSWLDEDLNKPLVMVRIDDVLLLYLHKNFSMEQFLWNEMERLISGKPVYEGNFNYDSIAELLYTPELCLRVHPGGEALNKDSDQIRALIAAWQNPLTIITGGPGTGKTSLLTNLLRGFLRMGIPIHSICLGAPTGRAAQRIVESIQKACLTIQHPDLLDSSLGSIQGETLHRILGARFKGRGFSYHRDNPLLKSVLVIDEASMVDTELMCRILSAIQEGFTKLIIIGDQDQLPSVDTGSVLADLVSYSNRHPARINKVILNRTYRSAGALLEWSKEIMNGQGSKRFPTTCGSMLDALAESDAGELTWVPHNGLEAYQKDISRWAKWFFREKILNSDHESFIQLVTRLTSIDLSNTLDEKSTSFLDISRALDHIHRHQVLALARAGVCGVENFNGLMSGFLARELGLQPGASNLQGTPIMVTSNDHVRGLFNGDIGLLVRDLKNNIYVVFRSAEKLRLFSLYEIRSWEPAFAITVHKSQGSEYDRVLMIFPDQLESPLLVREIVYTGITRAKRKVCVYARREILEMAMDTKAHRTSREFYTSREA